MNNNEHVLEDRRISFQFLKNVFVGLFLHYNVESTGNGYGRDITQFDYGSTILAIVVNRSVKFDHKIWFLDKTVVAIENPLVFHSQFLFQ